MVGVAWSGSEGEFQEFVDRHGLTFPQISDPSGEVFSRFGVAYQPAFAIVTADGEVQFAVKGPHKRRTVSVVPQA